jgi:glycosyltransferase involved in cell wall biosynthesis
MMHSIVIITRNRRTELLRLLDALHCQSEPPGEVVVVDAGDTPLRREEVPGELPFLFTVLPAAPGIARQRNAGLGEVRGDLVTFMDDDAVPGTGYLASVNSVFRRDATKEIVGAGGTLRNSVPRPLPERLFRTLFLLQTDRGKNRFRGSGFPDFNVRGDAPGTPHILPSTALSFRREAATGLRFDAACFSGAPLGLDTGRCFGEDAWFTAMLSRRGRLVLLPDAWYDHEPSSRNREGTRSTQALYVYAMRMLSDRFVPRRAGRALRAWALAGQGVLALLQALRYWDRGYMSGYLHAMRVRLQRLPRDEA